MHHWIVVIGSVMIISGKLLDDMYLYAVIQMIDLLNTIKCKFFIL